MKKFVFTLPKNNDKAKVYKNTIVSNIVEKYPWLTIESATDYPYSTDGVKYAVGGDYLTFGLDNKFDVAWYPKEATYVPTIAKKLIGYNLEDTTKYDLETEFFAAMTALDKFAKSKYPTFDKGYDFKVAGVPVKIFDTFVQIGYEIIPIMKGSLNHLKPSVKKDIIKITIKIKEYGLF